MESIATGFSGLPAPNKHIAKLETLCRTLVNICRPLIVWPQAAITSVNVPGSEGCPRADGGRLERTTPSRAVNDDHDHSRSIQKPEHARHNSGPVPGTDSPVSLYGEDWNLGVEAPTDPTLWDNELIWQLFNSEPCIDWYNACDSIEDWDADSQLRS